MIITRTPLRISMFGGGTDYPEYFMEHGGAVMATTIDKYCFVGLKDGKVWSHSDLPMRCGMATSSAFTIGLLKAYAAKDNKEIAPVATVWERDKLDGQVGVQDQYLCAVGGFHRLKFFASGIVDEVLDYDWLELYLMLFDTGQYRRPGKIVEHQLERIKQNQDALHQLKKLALADYSDYIEFGKALEESWRLKKTLAKDVSTDETDRIHEIAMEYGAVGGKLLGAGGGGFMVFVVEPDKQEGVRKALQLKQVEFKFEKEGSQVIYSDNR